MHSRSTRQDPSPAFSAPRRSQIISPFPLYISLLTLSHRVESIVLVPIDEDEGASWVEVLCDPLCGASLLMALIPGTIQASYGDTNSSQVDEMFVTVPPESLKPRRKSLLSTSTTRRKSTRRASSSGLGGAKTSALMEQSDVIIEEARAMMMSLSQPLLTPEPDIAHALSDPQEQEPEEVKF
jgi:hypothetical protein